MSRPAIRNQYLPVATILDECLRTGGGSFTTPSYAKAVLFRQQCYSFMKKYREADEQPSPYDTLIIRALPPKRLVVDLEAPLAVRIEVRKIEGDFVPDTAAAPDEPLSPEDLAAAVALRERLGL